MQETLQLSVDTLSWAARNKGYSLDAFARVLYKNETAVEMISKGKLTLTQIKKFSHEAKVPFGYLFLDHPPREYQPDTTFVDFRTTSKKEPLSTEFKETLKDIEHKQNWYRSYLIANGSSRLDFVGKYKNYQKIPIRDVASDIRSALKIESVKASNSGDYFSALSKACENLGILVFKNSVLINNTRCSLNPDEFRGFVISDDYAPAIFINGADSKNANIFTLAHELAHIWLGESGVSDTNVSASNNSEAICNAIAAEVLIPASIFLGMWEKTNDQARAKISQLNKHFKVSELALARVALTNNRIDLDTYRQVEKETKEAWLAYKLKSKSEDLTLPPIVMVRLKNSKTIADTVISLVKSNQMLPSEASVLLNKSAMKIATL